MIKDDLEKFMLDMGYKEYTYKNKINKVPVWIL
jgi:hypothetical protein